MGEVAKVMESPLSYIAAMAVFLVMGFFIKKRKDRMAIDWQREAQIINAQDKFKKQSNDEASLQSAHGDVDSWADKTRKDT